MDAALLQQLGLTDGESKVYLALLKTGSSTVGPIVKESGVAYSNIYEVLDRLHAKGLASFIIKSKTRHYQAAPPARITEYLAKKEQQLRKERETLQLLVPQLEQLQAMAGHRAEAEVFIGMEGMRSAFLKLMEGVDGGEHLYFYVQHDEQDARVDDFFAGLNDEYRKRNISMRGVASERYVPVHAQSAEFMTLRHVDFPVPSNIDICGEKIVIASWSVPLAVLITSKEIAEHFRTMFEDVWQRAKR